MRGNRREETAVGGGRRKKREEREEEERRKRGADDSNEARRLRRGRQAFRRRRGRLQAAQAGAGRQGARRLGPATCSAWAKPTGPRRRGRSRQGLLGVTEAEAAIFF